MKIRENTLTGTPEREHTHRNPSTGTHSQEPQHGNTLTGTPAREHTHRDPSTGTHLHGPQYGNTLTGPQHGNTLTGTQHGNTLTRTATHTLTIPVEGSLTLSGQICARYVTFGTRRIRVGIKSKF